MGAAAKEPYKPSVLELIALAACILTLALIYGSHIASMADNWWNDPNYSHGILIPFVSAYLIWRHREALPGLVDKPCSWGFGVILIGMALLAAGYWGSEFFLKRLSLIPVLWGLVLLVWGWKIAKRLWFAFAYLILMIPLPYVIYDSVAFPLRLIAASLAGGVLDAMGTPTLVEGNVIHLPYIVLNVVDACSGVRSLISLLAAGTILAYLILPNRISKIIIVLLVLPVTIGTNAIRVVLAGVIAKSMGREAIEGSMHDLVGWAVFMVAFIFLALITMLFNKIIDKWSTHGGVKA